MVKDPTDQGQFDNPLQTEVYDLIESSYSESKEKCDRIKEIARELIGIVDETDLPRFDVPNITSTANGSVEEKWNYMYALLTSGDPLPDWLRHTYNLDFSEVNLKVAPWVNLIQTTIRVMNYMNTATAIQKGESQAPALDIFLTSVLIDNLTVESDGVPWLRDINHISQYGEYRETFMRRAGTTVNTQRHVSMEEMRFILWKIRMQFNKDESKRNQLFYNQTS